MTVLKHFNKRHILISIIILTVVFAVSIIAFSLFDSNQAVHINPNDVPESTLAIGTHLIYLESLTEPLYEIAQASASNSNQTNIYYKSELADGTWFDITAAGSITDITTGSNSVDNSVIAELYFKYHTKEDGITYDLKTGEPVNIFNIINPYDLEALEELIPIKNRYDLEKNGNEDGAIIEYIEYTIKADVRNDETKTLDKYLEALDAYYKVLKENDAEKTWIDQVLEVQESVDATRRVEVFYVLDKIISGSIEGIATEKEVAVVKDDGTELVKLKAIEGASDLSSYYEESGTNVQDSLMSYMAKALSEGTSIASKVKYELQMKLIEDAEAGNHAACDLDVQQLVALNNITSGIIADRNRENALLDSKLIPMAESEFEADKSAGINEDYRTAQANQSSSVILNNIINTYYDELSVTLAELEMFIDSKCQRMTNSEAQALIDEKLTKANGYSASIKADDFQGKAQLAVNDYITWLEQKKQHLIAAAGGTEMDLLQAEKDALTEQYLSALDKNDLVGAKSIMSEINALANEMASLGQEQSPNSSMISNMKNEAEKLISDIANGEDGDPNLSQLGKILDSLDALMETDYKTAFPAVQDINSSMREAKYSGVGDDSTFDDMIGKAKEIIAANQDLYEAGTIGIKDLNNIDEIIDNYLKGLDGFNDWGKSLIAIDALNKAISTIPGTSEGKLLVNKMNTMVQKESIKGNPFVFEKMRVTTGVYAPIDAISAKTGWRYVWYKSMNNAILAKGSERYEFTSFSKVVFKNSESSNMPLVAMTQGILYVPAGYISSEWGYIVVNLTSSDFGILIDEQIDKASDELLSLIITK